jgi:hypothetical protein
MPKRGAASSEPSWRQKTEHAGQQDNRGNINLLFRPGEKPIFIDETASIEELAADRLTFLRRASQHFGIEFGEEHLEMTVPELAVRIRSARTR